MSDTRLLQTSLQRSTGLRRVAAIIAILGTPWMGIIGFMSIAMLGEFLWYVVARSTFYLLVPAIAGLALVEVEFLSRVKRGLERRHHPFAPWFAARQRRWPILLRPIVSIWWLFHFSVGIFLCSIVQGNFKSFDQFWIFLILDTTIAYASNIYALLALSALGIGTGPNGEQKLLAIWRWRLLLDVTAGLLASYRLGLLGH